MGRHRREEDVRVDLRNVPSTSGRDVRHGDGYDTGGPRRRVERYEDHNERNNVRSAGHGSEPGTR